MCESRSVMRWIVWILISATIAGSVIAVALSKVSRPDPLSFLAHLKPRRPKIAGPTLLIFPAGSEKEVVASLRGNLKSPKWRMHSDVPSPQSSEFTSNEMRIIWFGPAMSTTDETWGGVPVRILVGENHVVLFDRRPKPMTWIQSKWRWLTSRF